MLSQTKRYKRIRFKHVEGVWIEGVVTKIDPITFKVDTGSNDTLLGHSHRHCQVGVRTVRVVCIRHSKRLHVPARQREGESPLQAKCNIGDFHLNNDLMVEPAKDDFPDSEAAYIMKLAQFEMFWEQAI